MKPLQGFRDFFPEELALRNYLFDVWREVARSYGFEEYDGPPLEPLELYTRKSGEEIGAQPYSFVDKGERAVAARPGRTAPPRARPRGPGGGGGPPGGRKRRFRCFSFPPLFPCARPRGGRLREHFQL